MKHTIITLASVIAITGAAKAQTVSVPMDTLLSTGTYAYIDALGNNREVYLNFSVSDPAVTVTSSPTNPGEDIIITAGNGTAIHQATFNLSFNFAADYTMEVFQIQSNGEVFAFGGSPAVTLGPNHTLTGNQITGNGTAGDTSVLSYTATTAATYVVDTRQNTANGLAQGWGNIVIANQVPEPSSTALLGLGALGLIARRRR